SCLYYFFFFSSRRRHTRSKRDWSSDVCSSDLASFLAFFFFLELLKSSCVLNFSFSILFNLLFVNLGLLSDVNSSSTLFPVIFSRSEERRVGKECISRWLWSH